MIGSSIALSISDIPFNGPTGSALIGLIDGKFIINPTSEERDKSEIHLVVAGTKDAIMMVEAGANEVTEKVMLEGILTAHKEIIELCNFIENIAKEVGKPKKEYNLFKPNEEIKEKIIDFGREKLIDAISTFEKQERLDNIDKVNKEIKDVFLEEYPESEQDINEIIEDMLKEEVRRLILEEGLRPDNRK